MKKLVIFLLAMMISVVSSFGQQMVYKYVGGMIVKNGTQWVELIDSNPEAPTGVYNQTKEDANYYYISINQNQTFALPKGGGNLYLLNNNKWVTIPNKFDNGKPISVSKVDISNPSGTTFTTSSGNNVSLSYSSSTSTHTSTQSYTIRPKEETYDPDIHIRCAHTLNNHNASGCKQCGGKGYYEKVFNNVVTKDGIKNGVKGQPMRSEKEDCYYCEGSGRCRACKGTGKGVGTIATTNVRKSCHKCSGTGKCNVCNGKGTITYHYPITKSEKATTTDNSTQSDRTAVTTDESCGQCRGSGICLQCGGNGVYTYGGLTVTCNLCREKVGYCHVCKGKKTVPVTSNLR